MAGEDPLGILTGPYTLTSLRPPDLSKCTSSEILKYFENTYSLNESIFTILKSEDTFYRCPDRLRLPLIFYYGHTASVYINKLILAGLIKERVNPEMETIFETGVDEMNWDDTENYRMGGRYKWPTVTDVVQFRREVRSVIKSVIRNAVFHLPITMDSACWALFMGMEHERIHLETSSVLIRQLPIDLVIVPPKWKKSPVNHGTEVMQNEMILVPESNISLGKPFDFPSYGWDNEYPQIQSFVPEFEASKFLVTNGEFLEFIKDGGYEKNVLWSDEGWQWKLYRKAIHPTFWVCSKECKSGCGSTLSSYSHCSSRNINGQQAEQNRNIYQHSMYRFRTVCEEIEMPWLWPVEVNYHEAQAYCRWKGEGFRLLTEAEHNAIRDLRGDISAGTMTDPVFDCELHKSCNLNLAYCSSIPVNHYPPNTKGFHDVFGNVWQWTEDHFNGFPGTRTHFLYDDFSTPCFDGKHNIILGGSWISTGDEASRFARYSFRRHFFQHAGFRLARSRGSPDDIPVRLVKVHNEPKYEISCQVDDLSSKFLESTNRQFHDDHEEAISKQLMAEYSWPAQLSNYYNQLFQLCQQFMIQFSIPAGKALDLNIGCGRMTFELCRDFSQVVGTDFSESFLDTCKELQAHGSKCFKLKDPTGNVVNHVAKVPDDIDLKRAVFRQVGLHEVYALSLQLTWIPLELCDFDLVILHSLHRVNDKKAWLVRLQEVIKRGGMVIISTETLQESQLQAMLGYRLKCVKNQELVLNSSVKQLETSSVNVTAWMHV